MLSQTRYTGNGVQTSWSTPTGYSFSWSNPNDACLLDGHYATVSGAATGGLTWSWYIDSTNCGFSIPTDATIDSVYAEYYWYDSSIGGAWSTDYYCVLLPASLGTNNKAYDSYLPKPFPTWMSYGGNLWSWSPSLTLTPAQVNDSGFGVRMAVALHALPGTGSAALDSIRITVNYSTPETSVSISGVQVTSSRGILTRSGSARFGLTGVGTTAAYAGSAPLGTAGVSLIGRSAATSPGTIFAAAPGAGMFLWNWTYGVDAYWHEVLGSLMPETGAFISGVSAAGSVGTIVSTTNAQVALSGVEVTSAVGTHIGYSYAEAFITGVHVHSAVGNVSPSAHGDVNVPIVGRYATASIGTLIAAGTSVGFVSGVWLLYPVTIVVEQQWQCDIEVSEVANV